MTTFTTKDPDEVLPYTFNFLNELGASDAISGTPTITVSGVTLDSQSNTDSVVTVWLSGGTNNKTAKITCEIVSSGGKTAQDVAYLPIKEKG